MLLLCFATTLQAWAAIGVDANISRDSSSASTTITTPAFSTASGNELLLAFIATDYIKGSNTTVTNVSGGGLTWSLVRRTNVQSGTAEVWRAFATSTLSNASVTATLSQGAAASITVLGFTGVDTSGTNGSGAIGATGSGNSKKAAPSASLITTRNGSWVFGVGDDYDRAVARTPGPNQTVLHQYFATVGDTYWVQMQNSPTPLSGTTVTINDTAPTGDRYNLTIVEVLPALGAPPATYSVSGSTSLAGAGATVTLSQSGTTVATTTSDASGNFTFTNISNGSYTVTPAKQGFTFNPTSLPASVSGANVTGLAFTATAVTYTISGTITPATAGISVGLSGDANNSTTTNASGQYSFTGLANGFYTVSPSQTSGATTPTSRNVTINGANVSGVDFTLAVPTYSISGAVSPGQAGITLSLTGSATASTTTDALGNYTLSSVANGSYIVTPSQSGLVFSPTSTPVTVNSASITGINFTSQPAPVSPLAIDVQAFGDRGTSSTTVSSTAFSTTSGNELLLAFIASDAAGSGITVTQVSGGGLTWALVKRTNVQLGTAEIWRAFAPTQLNNVSVTATLSQSVQSSLTVMSFSGVDTSGVNGSGAIGATGTANATSGAPTVTMVSTRAGSLVLGVGNDYDNAIARTPGSNQALVHQYLAPAGDTYWVQMRTAPSANVGAAVPISDTAPTNDRWNLTAVEVLPPSSTPPPPPPNTHSISGNAGIASATVTLSGTASGSTVASSTGSFTFTNLIDGIYNVVPSLTGYTFSPTSQSVTVSGADVAGINFSASANPPPPPPPPPGNNVTVDGNVLSQSMFGVGTNLNTHNWQELGSMSSAIDTLLAAGVSHFRVIKDRMDWVQNQSDIAPLHSLDPATLSRIYETQEWQNVWATIAYLNSKGVGGDQIILNFMGWTATWMGGSGQFNVASASPTTVNQQGAFATMIATVAYYGHQVKGLSFNFIAPQNEPDYNGLEGYTATGAQLVTIYDSIVPELNGMGETTIKLVGPDTVGAVSSYPTAIRADSTVSPRMPNLSWHDYGSSASPTASGVLSDILSETSEICNVCDTGGAPPSEWTFAGSTWDYMQADIANGFRAIDEWEALDSWYYHHNSYSTYGMIAFDHNTGIYTPRQRLWVYGTIFKAIRPNMRLAKVTTTLGNLPLLAFYNSTTKEVSVAGHNKASSTQNLVVNLANIVAPATMHVWFTTTTKNLEAQPDVTVTSGQFQLAVPADTYFVVTFTN